MIHQELFDFDSDMRAAHGIICGVDEAGRGPLAGPVCCAACILPEGLLLDGLNDSKKMSEKLRDRLYEEIKEKAIAYSIVFIDNEKIDEINILAATMLGMRTAVEQLDIIPDHVLIDGNRAPQMELSAEAVVKGDAKSASIAAASVLAKVSRDRLLLEYAKQYPQYGFEKHKGYPTKAHYQAIDEFGILPIHRRSFLKGRA